MLYIDAELLQFMDIVSLISVFLDGNQNGNFKVDKPKISSWKNARSVSPVHSMTNGKIIQARNSDEVKWNEVMCRISVFVCNMRSLFLALLCAMMMMTLVFRVLSTLPSSMFDVFSALGLVSKMSCKNFIKYFRTCFSRALVRSWPYIFPKFFISARDATPTCIHWGINFRCWFDVH